MRTIVLAGVLGAALLATPAVAAPSSPEDYLKMARQAVKDQQEHKAVASLDRAEAEMMDETDKTATRGHPSTDPAAVHQIARAREAAFEHNWSRAEQYITMAMQNPRTQTGQ